MKYNGTIFNHLLTPANGMSHESNGLTALSRVTGKVSLDCPVCGMSFERYACWAKRKKVCYCSKACSDESKRRPVEMKCVVCSSMFMNIPSQSSKIVTCSDTCMKSKRRDLKKRGVLLPEQYRAYRGEGNGKLTPAQAQEIATSTESTSVLATLHKVSATTIRNIRRAHRTAVADSLTVVSAKPEQSTD